MPPDPPRRLVLRTAGCASHTGIVHHYLMAMQFQKWPIEFTFDWPFCPSNNFPLYCTLLLLYHKSDITLAFLGITCGAQFIDETVLWGYNNLDIKVKRSL